jgi:nicotinate phosphoribosyltransferase
LKLSEQAIKISNPGQIQVRRFTRDGECVGDMLYDEEQGCDEAGVIIDPQDPNRQKRISAGTPHRDLLVPVFRGGKLVAESPPISAIRQHAAAELSQCNATVRRLVNPHEYPVGLDPRLHELKNRLVRQARGLET